MDDIKTLFLHKKIYDIKNTDDLFLRSMVQTIKHHQSNCTDYNSLLNRENFNIDSLTSFEKIHLIPPLPTLFLKSKEMFSVEQNKLIIKSTTSGTSGRATVVGLDFKTCFRGFNMLKSTLSYHKMFSLAPTNYIILGYKPNKNNKMGAVKTAFGGTFLAPAISRQYALVLKNNEYVVNLKGIEKALIRYSNMKLPVRFLGFPSYFYFMLETLKENNIRLKLNKNSMVILGGGWKQFSGENVEKAKLYKMAKEYLGIDESNFREIFAVVENNILFCDCKNHHFHVPVYARVVIRDPVTLEPVKNGTPGILNLITPIMNSMPYCSIMTDDIAILYEGNKCGCGIDSPYFEILGRAGSSLIKTCTVGANELLGEVKN